MTIHKCESCQYNTIRKCDYDRHIKSQKHKTIVNNYVKNNSENENLINNDNITNIKIVKVDKVDILIKQNETVIKQN